VPLGPLIGLILGIISLKRAPSDPTWIKGLSIASICLGAALTLFFVLPVTIGLIMGFMDPGKDPSVESFSKFSLMGFGMFSQINKTINMSLHNQLDISAVPLILGSDTVSIRKNTIGELYYAYTTTNKRNTSIEVGCGDDSGCGGNDIVIKINPFPHYAGDSTVEKLLIGVQKVAKVEEFPVEVSLIVDGKEISKKQFILKVKE